MGQSGIRKFGLSIGGLPTGMNNAITDVNGIRVGHSTIFRGNGELKPGKGPVRTGVTVIMPHEGNLYQQKVRAAAHALNGHSKSFGLEQIREVGLLETPIALTNTLNVGIVADALIEYSLQENRDIKIFTINAVVGETNDYYLNDVVGRHVRHEHVFNAIESAASGPVQEGAVGAGTGTSCFGWKGGMGTSSRVLPEEAGGYTIGALVQSNYGRSEDFIACGVPIGRVLKPPADPVETESGGSIMIVVATDAPLCSRQLQKLCVRAGIGLGRTGSVFGFMSGDMVIAFSTAHKISHTMLPLEREFSFVQDNPMVMGQFFLAVTECVEEAILNSLFEAETVEGWGGHTRHKLPVEKVVALVRKAQDLEDLT
ncbi:MAG: P1 family peptidase [Anaerolineaceae bacterium]|nr:P1 family peptidase [Anaerolineaceae bacterium]